ncbi:uncharacterized protein BDZ83DRAFT_81907 [Colletotrichum acutatum]|uniref:Uncharacterized protein n=1 Tax=Glomerella acutata TaxID=27357 RepID=A0AAD8UDB7_GLOAC|nr:uncharacterized protein BDZ83DRAFT_81907 [Colletotrichum acutatum]KAK1713404.1 hypothetical protein BDZ83DRAFT_81907 [Colletotrichum acutatum]
MLLPHPVLCRSMNGVAPKLSLIFFTMTRPCWAAQTRAATRAWADSVLTSSARLVRALWWNSSAAEVASGEQQWVSRVALLKLCLPIGQAVGSRETLVRREWMSWQPD